MNRALILIILLSSSSFCYSQSYIKLNGATGILGVPGIGIEVPLSKKFSFQLVLNFIFTFQTQSNIK